MNMHGVVRGIVTAVNPDQTVTLKQSTGYTTNADFSRTPTYSTVPAQVQIQGLSGNDLRQIEGLNLQGDKVSMYFFGAVSGVIRASAKGGDLIVVACGVYAGTWLAAQLLEQWSDGGPASWCKIVAVLQDGS